MLPLSLLIPAAALAFICGVFPQNSRTPLVCQLAMVLAVLALFSIASAKRDDYVLPALPSLAILFAALFATVPDVTSSRSISVPLIRDATVTLIAIVILVGTILSFGYFREGGRIGDLGIKLQSSDAAYVATFADGISRLKLPFVLFAFAVALGSTIIFIGLRHRWGLHSGVGLAILCLAGSILWNGTLQPIEARTRSLAKFAVAVRSRVGTAPVYVMFYDPEFAWCYGSRVPVLPRAIGQLGSLNGRSVYLVARPHDLWRLSVFVRHGLKVVEESHVVSSGGPPTLYLVPSARVWRPEARTLRECAPGTRPPRGPALPQPRERQEGRTAA
jgi:hypothetical protein